MKLRYGDAQIFLSSVITIKLSRYHLLVKTYVMSIKDSSKDQMEIICQTNTP